MTLFTRFAARLDAALDTLVAAGTLPGGLDRGNVTVEPPRDPAHGDLATNAAMVLAKPAGDEPARARRGAGRRARPSCDDVAEARSPGPASSTCA